MNRQDQQYFEDITTLTGYPEWAVLVKELEHMIYHTQANAIERTSWEKVNEDRGFAKGLAYIVNLREDNKKALDIVKANADI